jgi:hypothetical protein
MWLRHRGGNHDSLSDNSGVKPLWGKARTGAVAGARVRTALQNMLQHKRQPTLIRREKHMIRLFAHFARLAFGISMSAFGLFLAALAPFIAAAAALFLIARALGIPLLVP